VDGRNVRIDQRLTNDLDRTRMFAKELVELQSDVIVAISAPATAALQGETHTIPIVFAAVADPVGQGFISSLPRPGGNITGFSNIEGTMAARWVQMIKEIAPHVTHAAAMYNPDSAPYAKYFLGPFKAATQTLAMDPSVAQVHSVAEIEATIESLGREHGGLVVLRDTFMSGHHATVIAAATRNKVPTISEDSGFASLDFHGT
jgi:putative tryptophan/tyrosine transport system substrate-binding protein